MHDRTAATESKSRTAQPFFGAQRGLTSRFFSSSAAIQTKLTVGESGDPFEREADSVADRVVQRMDAGRISRASAPAVQAACAACEEKEKRLQRKAEGSEGPSAAPASVEQSLGAGHSGHSLAPPLQAEMEGAFQADFSSVRIHTGSSADQLNHDLQARAFTHGNDIYFNSGEFQPDSRAGKHLLAHELTHVVQQSGSQSSRIQRACGAAAIGAPAGCAPHLPIFLEGYPTFKFTSECDTFAAGEEAALIAHATSLPATASFEVHGYSSADGNATFNKNLSCARAAEARRVLTDPSPGGAGIPAARITGVFAHGGTPGAPAETRASVMLTPPRPTPMPTGIPVPAATDFTISRVGNSTTSRLFFEAGSDALTTDATTQIDSLKKSAPASVRVIGYISVGEGNALAQSRADAVEAALTAAPDAVTVTSAVGTPGAMNESSDLVEARSVEMVVGAAPSTKLDCKAKDPRTRRLINPRTQACATMDPATDTAFKAAHPIAQDAMSRAVTAVSGVPDAVTEAHMDQFFGDHGAATLATLRTNLGKLQTEVNGLPGLVKCGGQCDIGGCNQGAIAYHSPANEPKRMVLCVPAFQSLHANDQPRNLIHETAHGTSPLGGGAGKGTEDLAYRHERMLFQLSTADRLRNSDSYAMFAIFLREAQLKGVASATPAGISTPETDSTPGITGLEKAALDLALARLEKRLGWCTDWVGQLYGQVNDIRIGKQTWARSWAEDLMKEAANRFPLTRPRTKPKIDDQVRIAGILDRYLRMHAAVNRDLTVTKAATGVVNWPVSKLQVAGSSLSVGPDYFRLVERDQVGQLLEALARATVDVEPAFIPGYVTLAEWIHSRNT